MPSAMWPAFQREVGAFGLLRGKEPFFLVFTVQTPMQPPRPTEMCHLLITFPIPGADHSSPTQGAVGEQSGQGLEAPGTFASTFLCISTSFCTPHAKTRPPTCPAETSQFRIKKETVCSLSLPSPSSQERISYTGLRADVSLWTNHHSCPVGSECIHGSFLW